MQKITLFMNCEEIKRLLSFNNRFYNEGSSNVFIGGVHYVSEHL